jgi:hypothetical protein
MQQVELHRDKLSNPDKYDNKWNNKNEIQKQGLLRKWEKDIKRNQEQAEILMRIREVRKNG